MASIQLAVAQTVIQEVAENLSLFRGRTFLALLGIVIGTAAVITMLHLGHSAREAALKQFEVLGTDQAIIQFIPDGGERPKIALANIMDIPAQQIGLNKVSALVQSGTSMRFGQAQIQAMIVAATDEIYSIGKVAFSQGRGTSDLDGASLYAVLGAGIAGEMERASGRSVSLGDKISVGPQVVTVIGVLKDAVISPVLGLDFNRVIIVPFAAAGRVLSSDNISGVAALLTPDTNDVRAAQAITEYLDRHIAGGAVQVTTARQLIDNIDRQMGIYAALILGIGAVSLVVGGVGIMNVMLMTVIERRQEIGLRIALGARRSHIRLMFLCEALILSFVGSVIGTLVGYLTGWIFATSSGWQFEVAPLTLPVGIAMAVLVGLFSGIYPAARASRLDPAIALRSE